MNIQTIAEHKVDVDLLPEKAKILDAGCRGFLFTDEMRRRGHNVIAIDIEEFDRKDYHRVALTGTIGTVGIRRNSDPQGSTVTEGIDIPSYHLNALSFACHIIQWDLIKMDIEGSEQQVIYEMPVPMAKQLSIEFHLHTGIYTEKEVDSMVAKLESLGYETVSHEKTSQHGMGFNYWSSLFILKS